MLLRGIKVIEFAGLAPAPFCGKILSDFGADVVIIDKSSPGSLQMGLLDANKRSLCLNLKKKSAIGIIERMCKSYDVLIDPHRPGTLENLGIGPAVLMKKSPQLIYARISGFGQSGPLVKKAGHDNNYVAMSGILSMLGRKGTVPTPPINLVADFAGGGLLCAFGIVMSLYDRMNTGKGQIVDMGMSEGAAYVGSWIYAANNTFLFDKPRGENWLDSGAHFYDTYVTKDGKYLSVGAIEPQFFQHLLIGLNLNEEDIEHMSNMGKNKEIFAAKFKEKTRDEWCKIFEPLDACVFPVLSLEEAPNHPHNLARKNFRKVKNQWEPVPAPRLTDINGVLNQVVEERQRDSPPCPDVGEHSVEVLQELGYSQKEIEAFIDEGVSANTLKAKL